MKLSRLERAKRTLQEKKDLYELVGKEIKENAEKGRFIQMKSAQNRSLSLARTIMNLEAKVNKLMLEEKQQEERNGVNNGKMKIGDKIFIPIKSIRNGDLDAKYKGYWKLDSIHNGICTTIYNFKNSKGKIWVINELRFDTHVRLDRIKIK